MMQIMVTHKRAIEEYYRELAMMEIKKFCGFCFAPGAMMKFNKQDREWSVTLSPSLRSG